jgi:hypothetical protein
MNTLIDAGWRFVTSTGVPAMLKVTVLEPSAALPSVVCEPA